MNSSILRSSILRSPHSTACAPRHTTSSRDPHRVIGQSRSSVNRAIVGDVGWSFDLTQPACDAACAGRHDREIGIGCVEIPGEFGEPRHVTVDLDRPTRRCSVAGRRRRAGAR